MADLSVTAANVAKQSGTSVTGTAGATITAGQVVYLDAADGKYKLADASAATTDGVVGIALNGGADGQPLTIQTSGIIDPGATATEGVVYCLSATAGGIAPVGDLVTNDYVTVLGVGNAGGNIVLSILASGAQVQ